jgi:hypothetical protein
MTTQQTAPSGCLHPLVGLECWFCHSAAVEVWGVADFPDETYPMCEKHVAHVRSSLALRTNGDDAAADVADRKVGIETRPRFCKWTEPNVQDQATARKRP